MSYYLSLSLAPFTDDLVVPLGEGQGRDIPLPPGYWVNYVQWRWVGAGSATSCGGGGAPWRWDDWGGRVVDPSPGTVAAACLEGSPRGELRATAEMAGGRRRC